MKSYRKLIEVAELQDLLGSAECRVVDCRFDLLQPQKGRTEYLAGHVPGALYADLDQDLAGPVTKDSGRHPLPDTNVFRATLQGWGIGPGTQVVVYDYASGALAARLWWMLRWFGHSQVAVLNGGLKAWIAGDGTLATEVPEFPESTLLEAPDSGRVITTDEVYSMLGKSDETRLVDARDRARFNGQTEPIDSVAGHVPGAINFPFSGNLNADGTWKSSQELRQAWAGLLGSGTPPPFSVMCGSGVTACHLVLSAAIAGLPEPRVYIGSWSEWLRDTARPVA
jgi:thiosulfate/3-mercaptopyruvate sulfurtransferase